MNNSNLVPVLFNALKHHLGHIRWKINQTHDLGQKGVAALLAEIPQIGNSQMDLYTGSLSISQIAQEVIHQLQKEEHYAENLYHDWLLQGQNYQLIYLSDGSSWTLLWGDHPECYIHIHPARHSLHTTRVRALSLKTAILAASLANVEAPEQVFELDFLNRVRADYLAASPLQQVSQNEGIGQLISLLLAI